MGKLIRAVLRGRGDGNIALLPDQCVAAISRTEGHQQSWRSQGVAAVYPGDGRRRDGSRVVAQRGTLLSRATVAIAPRAITGWPEEEVGHMAQDRSVSQQARRREQGADNPLRDLMTG
jgi:hypothetical protein